MSQIKIDINKFNETINIVEGISKNVSDSMRNIRSLNSGISDIWKGCSANSFRVANEDIENKLKTVADNIDNLAQGLDKICEEFIEQDKKISNCI